MNQQHLHGKYYPDYPVAWHDMSLTSSSIGRPEKDRGSVQLDPDGRVWLIADGEVAG